ncbi:immunoglobulin-binding protein 1 [Dendroctonus ponderosae]|uniref:Immunoglobulin-binding protein 1 n=1 Tax=Dendroctonus ponderosae TaxID=77166 RepID=J3JWA3_DENPD|nr:immunoglobulin-binding protein 1 [Dendroctonus ponderosae]AEE62483.1 unknown [Dendroctonus ponderosae]ERL86043.1 hypothetical protein D910_03457 [Dendroctonus ponderosae]KAH1010594.1 hypothetical protein HUJ05_004864 [Dendroctonus ponderosae]KAH1010595.1 hypothetical protein HUJ05_004864 [Dendroctonus ponderosae]
MAAADEDVSKNLHAIFHEGLNLYNKISQSNEPTQSLEVQRDVKKAISCLEQATRLVSVADIFSSNEEIEELSTSDIQYLLLPALLGSLTSKLTSRERKEVIEIAEIYLLDFLQRTNSYKLSNYKIRKGDGEAEQTDGSNRSEIEQLTIAVNTRNSKIQKFKEFKELKTQLENLKKNVENEHADEEIKRNYFLTMIKVMIHEAIDELDSIKMEKPILAHIAQIKQDGGPKPKRQPPPPPPLKPIIITKDQVQKAIYGAGYPSMPTMTVDEFYEKRVAEGAFPDPNKPRTGPMSMQEASLAGISLNDSDKEDEENENKVEADDDENIQRLRARDEYKDEHRRGWGNRMNRS